MDTEYYDADRWKFLSDYDLPKKQTIDEDEGPRFCYSTAGNLLTTDIEHAPSIWGNFFPRNGVVCIAGESECGKSIFLRQLAIEYCTNKTGKFLGMKFDNKYKRALYISTEDDYYAFSALLKKQCNELNVKPEDLKKMYVVFQTNKIVEKIENFLFDTDHVGLIIIDCLNDILPNQAKSDIALRKFLNRLQDIATYSDSLIIVSHHTSKYARKKTPSKHNLKGPQGIEEKCRTVFEIRTDNFQKNIKHLCVVKANYINDEDKKKSYMLELTPQLIFKNTGRRTDIDTLTRSLVYPFIRSPNKKPCARPFMGGVITSGPRVRRHPCLRRV